MTALTEINTSKYLTFALGAEEYGIPISKVKEIIGMTDLTQVPNLPVYMRGVLNLREHIIPIVDLRLKFAMPEKKTSDRTCIIVLEIQHAHSVHCREVLECDKKECPAYNSTDHRCWMMPGTHCQGQVQGAAHDKATACQQCRYYQKARSSRAISTLGVIVDGVSEVANIGAEQIEPPPSFSETIDSSCLTGIAKADGKVKILLDIDQTIAGQQLSETA